VSLNVRLVTPEGEIWAGPAEAVIAKTLEGDIGLLTGHSPVLGILAHGSVVRILPQDRPAGRDWIQAAVSAGFLAIADDKVSILARQAALAADVNTAAVRADLETAIGAALVAGEGEPPTAGFLRAQLRAAGEDA
jgi:F-type H+-transporting ATPase subunit epsilon